MNSYGEKPIDEQAFLGSGKIANVQQANPQVLVKAMLASGFAPNPQEWWYFSYSDKTWANYYD